MCDQDHFDDDLKEFDARGLVTRRQFGVLLGAGVAMLLPQVANAVTVTESDVTIDDARRHRRLLLRAPGDRHGSRRARVAGHLRPAAGIPHRWASGSPKPATRCWSSIRSIASRRRRPLNRAPRRPSRPLLPLAQALNETTHMTDAKAFIGVAGSAVLGRQEPQDRHAGLLHGRPDGVPHRRRDARSRRRGRLVPRRRTRHAEPEQPASAGGEDEGAVPHRGRRRTTTCARPTRRTC